MSTWSDYKCGGLSDIEYNNECIRENMRERAYLSRQEVSEYYTDDPDDPYWEKEEEGEEE